jgi:predicted nucleic acid-binding protein
MKLFFDTSALVKNFHNEQGTETIIQLLNDSDNIVYVSELVRVEFLSALMRRYREHELDESVLRETILGFNEIIDAYFIEPVSSIVLQEAENLMKQFGKTHALKTLDSLHLSTFSLIAEEGWCFVAADRRLCLLVDEMGFRSLNPLM